MSAILDRDYDLRAALEYNNTDLNPDDIQAVLAVVYGEHDESNYYWIILTRQGEVGLLSGGHDYTGWD